MNIKELFEFMTKEDKDAVRTLIHGRVNPTGMGRTTKGHLTCPLCNKNMVVRNGHRPDGGQRYICKDCHKSFTPTSNSLIKGTKKKIVVWERYLQCMLEGKSLSDSSEECKIHRNTAFAWRHKILDAMGFILSNTRLDGIIELDSSSFRISFKGNHTRDKMFRMPRKPKKNGSTKKGLGKDRICVPCAIRSDGISISKISNMGKKSIKGLNGLFKGKIEYRSVIITRENNTVYRRFSSENNLRHLTFFGTDYTHCENYVKSEIYIHERAKFMTNFRGVSTKYLNNYIVWFNMVNYSAVNMLDWENLFFRLIPRSRRLHTNRNMSQRPAVPLLA